MAATPSFAAKPKLGIVNISTANTNRDGTGTIGTVLSAGASDIENQASGSRVRGLAVKATGTTTAGMVRIYLHDGTTARLWREIPVSAITPSATVESFSAYLNEATNPELFPLALPSGWSLRASTHNAESFNVVAEGPDL